MIMDRYTSDKNGELIPVVIIEFHDLNDLWLTKEQYKEMGLFKGILKEMSLSIRSIKKVHHLIKKTSSFPATAWEG